MEKNSASIDTPHSDVAGTGPLARGYLIWPPGHLLYDSTGLDGSLKSKT